MTRYLPISSFLKCIVDVKATSNMIKYKNYLPKTYLPIPDVTDAICAVTSAQYLSPSGWVTLRDLVDNDVPFSLYRDEGSTFLQVLFFSYTIIRFTI